MNTPLFWLVFIVLSIIYFTIAIYASKNIKNKDDYFLAGRNYGIFTLTCTLMATQIGAGMLLGTSQESYFVGLYGLLYNAGTCLGFLILGSGIAGKLRKFEITTIAELFEKKYNSSFLRKAASLLSIITLGGILSGQILASRKLMATFNLDINFIITGFWLLVIFYTMFGGLKAVVATDVFQVAIILTIFSIIFVYSIYNDETHFLLNLESNKNIHHYSKDKFSFSRLFPFLIMPIFFSLIEQDLAQRFFSAKTQYVAIFSSLLAAIFIMIFSLIPAYFGIKAKSLEIFIPDGTSPIIAVIKNTEVELFLILAVCALIAAITSTGDSILCAISSNIMNDFKSTKNIDATIKPLDLLFCRIITLIVGISAIILAYNFNNIISIMTQSYELSVSCLFIPIIFCFFKKKLSQKAAFYSMIFGLFSFIIFRIFPIDFSRELISLFISFIGYIIGMLISEFKIFKKY